MFNQPFRKASLFVKPGELSEEQSQMLSPSIDDASCANPM